jgi:hypothetical protein
LANLSDWRPERIEALRRLLRKQSSPADEEASSQVPLEEAFEITASRPHGHAAAVLGMLRQTKLERLLSVRPSRERDLCVGLIAARVLDPGSKLATARCLHAETRSSTLGELLHIDNANEDELYEAMDWLLSQQTRIENVLAKRHLTEGNLVLYDVSSTYFEGRKCSLAKLGHSRDGKRDKLQIVFGLLTDKEGCPVAVEVFDGNVGDPKTLASQVHKLRTRFGIKRLILVGDRGMITDARIREDLSVIDGFDWITALRAPAIAKLVASGSLQLSLFDKKDLAEITDPAFPGERLIVCKNPLLAQERSRKRQDLLEATERALLVIVAATTRKKQPLRGRDKIALRVGKVLGRHKVGKHFVLDIGDDSFCFERNVQSILEESSLDGLYVIRTQVQAERLSTEEVVRSYKRLSTVERAFRCMKLTDLRIRPIHHHKADRVRAHVFLCMLSYYVEWHMRRALAPILFDDDDKPAGEALRESIVAPALTSPRALEKATTKRSEDGLPVHSFQTLLRDLATLTKNRVQPKIPGAVPFDMLTTPSPVQQRAFQLLKVSPRM